MKKSGPIKWKRSDFFFEARLPVPALGKTMDVWVEQENESDRQPTSSTISGIPSIGGCAGIPNSKTNIDLTSPGDPDCPVFCCSPFELIHTDRNDPFPNNHQVFANEKMGTGKTIPIAVIQRLK